MELANKFLVGVTLSKIDATQALYAGAQSEILGKIEKLNSLKVAAPGYCGVLLGKNASGDLTKVDVWENAISYSVFSNTIAFSHPDLDNFNVQVSEKCANLNVKDFFTYSSATAQAAGVLPETYVLKETLEIAPGMVTEMVEAGF